MNLGAFVGGAVQGYNVQERSNLARKEMEANTGFRERQMQMAEQDQAAQQETRGRDKAMREASAALFTKYYGEKQETVDQTTSDDGQGGAASIPTVKTTRITPGMDSALDNKWAMENAMIVAQHSGMSTEEMGKIAQGYETARQSATGKALDKVLGGDEAALGAFLKGIGKDPAGAKLDNRPVDGVRQIILADGSKPIDLRQAYQTTALAARYKQLLDEESGAQKLVHEKATVRNLNAQAGKSEAEALEAPAKGKLLAAQTYQANQAGNLSGVKAADVKAGGSGRGGGGGGGANAKALAAADKTLQADPTYKLYDTTSRKTVGQALAASLRNGSNPQQAAKEALDWHEQMVARASAALKKSPMVGPDGKKVTAAQLVAMKANEKFGGGSQPAAEEE